MKSLSLVIVFCALSLGFAFTSPVYACGGGASDNIQYLLERTDIVVKADITSVDDVRQNAILAVDSYLYGTAGAKYLVFEQMDPVIVQRETEGGVNDNCRFFQAELRSGQSGYFFLSRRADGVYESTSLPHDPNYYDFPTADTTYTLYHREDDNSYIEHVLDEAYFIDFVTEYGHSSPTEPDQKAIYPRLAPLKITTDASIDYVLPVDTNIPIKVTDEWLKEMTQSIMGYDSTAWNEAYFSDYPCPGKDCVQISPDGINRAEQVGEEIHWFWESVAGRAFQFSSTSDAIAIWNKNFIEFYTLGWAKRDQQFNEVTQLNRVPLTGDLSNLPYQSAWSPDGRFFAYSDSRGLWSLDVYDPSAEAQQEAWTNEGMIPVALAYSPLGRYLQVQQGNERFYVDTVNGDRFPDGLISPDDQILLAFPTQEHFPPQICFLVPVRDCQEINERVLPTGTDTYAAYTRYIQAQWRNGYSFLMTICQYDNPNQCLVDRIDNAGGSGLWYANGEFWSEGYTFDYFPKGDVLAIVQDGKTLSINDEIVDLSSRIEGEIVAIEWLPSLFYSA